MGCTIPDARLTRLPELFTYCLEWIQGRSQGCKGCECTRETRWVPQRTSNSYVVTPTWIHHSKCSWDTYEASCSQMSSFEVLGAQPGPTVAAGGPWSRPGSQRNSKRRPFGNYGAIWGPCRRGPLARRTRLEKSHAHRNILKNSD